MKLIIEILSNELISVCGQTIFFEKMDHPKNRCHTKKMDQKFIKNVSLLHRLAEILICKAI